MGIENFGVRFSPQALEQSSDIMLQHQSNSGIIPGDTSSDMLQFQLDQAKTSIQNSAINNTIFSSQVDVNGDGVASVDEINTFTEGSGLQLPSDAEPITNGDQLADLLGINNLGEVAEHKAALSEAEELLSISSFMPRM